jgi:hypothetical protein
VASLEDVRRTACRRWAARCQATTRDAAVAHERGADVDGHPLRGRCPGGRCRAAAPDSSRSGFNPYEVAALAFAVLVLNYVTSEGESNWFEGIQLLALYVALSALFLVA